jgi:rhamnose utilization protein RhaD (predicted bifunctional aldolase and dehydrogenase)
VAQTTDHLAKRADRLPNKWNAERASQLSEPELLLYRSNLLGSDLRITNYGGGNTSAKLIMQDPLTRRDANVLWVKGSGGDLASIGLDGFATLYLDKLYSLKALYRGFEHEDEMVAYFAHCAFNLNPRATRRSTALFTTGTSITCMPTRSSRLPRRAAARD